MKQNVAKILALEAVIDEIASVTIAIVMKMEKTAIPAAADVGSVAARAHGTNTNVLLLTVVEISREGPAKSTKEDLPVVRQTAEMSSAVLTVAVRTLAKNAEAGKSQ